MYHMYVTTIYILRYFWECRIIVASPEKKRIIVVYVINYKAIIKVKRLQCKGLRGEIRFQGQMGLTLISACLSSGRCFAHLINIINRVQQFIFWVPCASCILNSHSSQEWLKSQPMKDFHLLARMGSYCKMMVFSTVKCHIPYYHPHKG